MPRGSALRIPCLSIASLIFLYGSARATPLDKATEPGPVGIYGGEEAKLCEFPTTAGGTRKCTATLIHPQVVISAGHCGPLKKVFFGERRTKPAFVRETKWCELTQAHRSDAQICVLKKPVQGLPFAPIIQGCETEKIKVGAKVILAGFGLDENDPAQADDSYKDEKRWVQTEIVRVTNDALHIGKDGKGGCNGDSGGPAFLQMEDGTWRTLGATHAGANGESHPNCATGVWKRADELIPWYEEQLEKHGDSDLDITPCFDDSGKWSPTRACGGYSKDIKGPFGDWGKNCGEGVPTVKYSATCGEPFQDDSEDDNPSGEDKASGPQVKITQPSPKQRFDSGSAVTLKAKVKSKADLDRVELWVDDNKVESKSEEPYEWTLDELSDGKYRLRVLAHDTKGGKGKSEVTIVVGPAGSDDSPDPSGDEPQDPDNDASPKDKDKGKDKEDPSETGSGSKDSAKADKQASDDKKGGCAVQDHSPSPLAILLGLSLFYRRRRV